MIRLLLLLFVSAALCLSFVRCEKEPEIITETIIKTDTLYVLDTVVQHITDTLTLTELVPDTATTFLLVRHAETSGAGSDPTLSTLGQERAAELVRVLKNVPVQAVYASNYQRTQQTAQGVATDKGLSVQTYDPLNQSPVADAILDTYRGQTVLLVGHSNTVPALLNLLTGSNAYSTFPETQYDNFFVVSVYKKGQAKVVHLKYGKP